MQYSRSHCVLLDGYSPALHKRLEDMVRQHPYASESAWGFRMLHRRQQSFTAEHIERQIHEDRVTDPFGAESVMERVVYVTTTVLVQCSAPHMILLDPPSTSRQVIHKLCGYTDFTVAVLNPSIDVPAWARGIAGSAFRLTLSDLRMNDVDFGSGFSGSLSLSGEGDVFRKAESVVRGRKHVVSAVGGIIKIGDDKARIRIHGTGRVELSRAADSDTYLALYATCGW